MSMPVWKTKADTVEAVQLTVSNSIEIARWSGGVVVTFPHGNNEVNVPTTRGVQRVMLGMFVVRDSEKRFWVMSDTEFLQKFERMPNHG